MMTEYKPQREPWAHQRVALSKLWGQPSFALLMAMRTGKSKVTIDDFGRMELEGLAQDLLLIAPAGVYETWFKAFGEHASRDLLERAAVLLWRPGGGPRAAKVLEAFLDDLSSPRVLIIDVEALSTVERARRACLKFLSPPFRRSVVVIDESTVIKNPESSRARFCVEQLKFKATYRRILSGLPTPRSPLDLYNQFAFLDRRILGFANYAAFEARYAEFERICLLPNAELARRLSRHVEVIDIPGIGRLAPADLSRDHILRELEERGIYVQTIPRLRGYRNEGELAERIAPYSYRCLLSDCYDVPPKLYSFWDVELLPEQRRVYDELRTFATAELESMTHVTATHVMTRITKLHQVLCGHVKDEEGVVRSIPENRTAAVLQILETYDSKAIIWCSYDFNVNGLAEAIKKVYGDGSVARFWGGNRSTREKEERRFLEEPECRFMVATPAAGGRGRTWTVANLLIYFSNTNNLEHRSQSEERGDGNLKEDKIACIDLRARATVDDKIINALRQKIDMAARITGDHWREWVI